MEHTRFGPLPWSVSEWSEATMGESLRLAAESLCAFGGFGAAAIAVVRDDQVVPIAVAGAERLLDADGRPLDAAEALGTTFPVDQFEDELLPLAETWDILHFIPHDRASVLPDFGWRVDGAYVGPEWHPDDLLLVPVRDGTGRLRGMLSMDAPTDGFILPKKGKNGDAAKKVLEYIGTSEAETTFLATDHWDVGVASGLIAPTYNAIQKKSSWRMRA